MANVTIAVNTSSSDVEYDGSGATWDNILVGTDYLVFSAGSTTVDDGHSIPSESDYIAAGILLTGSEVVVARYFLADIGVNTLKEIFLMGNTTGRYVMAFSFSAATATEPVLELWDDSDLDSVTSTSLGAGTPSNSWWRGITTTAAAPSADWAGSYLAGSTEGNYLNLNNGSGALSVADILYCNLKVVIPSFITTGTSATPVFAVKYASN